MMTTDEASAVIANILKSLPLNINRKELEALAMAQIALEDWYTQYERGYVDGTRREYRKNFEDLNVIIDE